MYLSSLNGRRTISVAPATCNRVIDHICDNPYMTAKEYAEVVQVAETTVNLIISQYLLDLADQGRIAVSDRGRKPDWYFQVRDTSIVPVRRPSKPSLQPLLPGIFDDELRQDYSAVIAHFNATLGRSMSPAVRAKKLADFIARVSHIGADHQYSREETKRVVARLESKMDGMQEAIQVMASALTSASVTATA